jgi:hypothetical protein
MYFVRPQNVEAERLQGARRRSVSVKANAPLGCLTGGALASRFHAWHGHSGLRYVCSVYPVDQKDASAGLPELGDSVVIGVAFDANASAWRFSKPAGGMAVSLVGARPSAPLSRRGLGNGMYIFSP